MDLDKCKMQDSIKTDKVVCFSHMTKSERVSIISPLKGLLIEESNTGKLFFYNGSKWLRTYQVNYQL